MMGDSTIRPETRERVRKLCEEAGLPDLSEALMTEQDAAPLIEQLEKQIEERQMT